VHRYADVGLSGQWKIAFFVDHRFTLEPPMRPSAFSKKIVFQRELADLRVQLLDVNLLGFHAAAVEGGDHVFQKLLLPARSATLPLNAGEWFRRERRAKICSYSEGFFAFDGADSSHRGLSDYPRPALRSSRVTPLMVGIIEILSQDVVANRDVRQAISEAFRDMKRCV